MAQTVLILGANGKIGSHASQAFKAARWTVKHYDRSQNNLSTIAADADVIVNGLNPPMYNDWAKNIPAITGNVIDAAKVNDATVIIPGNIYNYGEVTGEISESTPQRPNTRKGKIRVAMEDAYRQSGIRTIVLRAGNFIDPLGNGDIMELLVMRSVKKQKITTPSDPDTTQAYCYVPDWARAAVALAEKRDELEMFEDIPFPGHAFSISQLVSFLNAETGQTHRITSFPWWMMRVASPFLEVAREMAEMRYLFAMNHWIGSQKFERLLPDFKPTPARDVMLSGLQRDIDPN